MQPKQIINIIVAVADDWAIGRDGDMPWHISEDMKFFKAKTMGGSLIMGRRTWESIGCKPLPGRENIVVSARLAEEGLGYEAPADAASGNDAASRTSALAVSSLEEALEVASRPNVFVMGGGMIYRQAIDIADRLFVTHVHTLVPDADTFFPVIDPEVWQLYERSNTSVDPRCGLKYEFRTYLRRSSDE
jgi:dihydrofolate reductase